MRYVEFAVLLVLAAFYIGCALFLYANKTMRFIRKFEEEHIEMFTIENIPRYSKTNNIDVAKYVVASVICVLIGFFFFFLGA